MKTRYARIVEDKFIVSKDAIEDSITVKEMEDKVVIGYLMRDESPMDPLEDMDGQGRLYRWPTDHWTGDEEKYREAVKADVALILNCYVHSGFYWYVSGHAHAYCQHEGWDTVNNAGVWVPDAVLKEMLAAIPDRADRHAKAVEYCEQALEMYNAYVNGDVYGWGIGIYDRDGKVLEENSCYGYYGCKDAVKEMEEEVERTVKSMEIQETVPV